tara:strand:+ start:249 stop:1106 length:858 start_codon:yes stop_codon:yes gene_type:complete
MFGLGNRKERLQRREERLTRRIDSAEDEEKKKRLEERRRNVNRKKKEAAFADYYKSLEENYKGSENNPFRYTMPKDALEVIEGEESSPVGYMMTGSKVKGSSPNQAFSIKDYNTITGLQGDNKINSEGTFRTNSQNIYASFDSPVAFRGMNAAFKKDSGPTQGMWSLKMGDRITQQNAQGLQNASTVMTMATDLAKMVMAPGAGSGGESIAGMLSDRRLKKSIKLIGLSPAGLKIYSFKYKNPKHGKGTYQGVMSDEIPSHAVIKNADGYDMVNYDKLDVEFKKI